MQSLLTSMLNNMESTDTFYSLIFPAGGAESTSVINQSANRLIRTAIGANKNAFGLFPELQETFNLGPTVAGTNTLTRPTNCIAIQKIMSSQSATLPTWDTTREYTTVYMPPARFGALTKDSNVRPDYVRIYTLIGKKIAVYPTPAAGYIDYLRLYGLKAEANLVNGSDVFVMDPDFHPLVVKLAASDLADKMDWPDKSVRWYNEVLTELGVMLDVSGEQITGGSVDFSDVLPTRGSVYHEF